ncbi:hypothetical protein FPHYL_4052 [Fusarium phyllophilum]|uniref:Uncharacterized protein n=1 Tax=Fusarium phyllophilum TaxID=47803 RepID=A0A8H5K311_9HYPO|nr:hypothetical protein FPHYL_4052 [Fusarium phyllophilum]
MSRQSSSRDLLRFGVWAAIATSFIVLVEAIIFLSWLWFEDRESEAWRRFMLSGRATQSITLMSVLIRWAIGTLAAITTSMAASIALELHGVPISALAEVSIARFTNSGPQSFRKMLPGTTFRPWLRILMIFLFALVGASQFASTLLVSDLRELTILSLKKNMSYGFNFGGLNDPTSSDAIPPLPVRGDGLEYWNKVPSQYEIFAEYSEPKQWSDELDDTGTVLRAFLPISTMAQRESIQSFNGIARVIDTHVLGAAGTEDRAISSRRQILNISPSMLKRSLHDTLLNSTARESWLSSMGFPDLAICSSCDPDGLRTVSPLTWQIFTDIIDTTNSPALAIQALTTLVWRMAYYEHITSYSEAVQPARVTTFDLVQAPVRKWGFTTLMAIIIGNIIIFLVIAFIFLSHTESSFLENAWHTVAQISQNDKLRPILERVTLASDQDVGRMIRVEEPPKDFMGNVKDFFCSTAVSATFSSSATDISSTFAESATSTVETLATETSTVIESETTTAIDTTVTEASTLIGSATTETTDVTISSRATSGSTLFTSVTSADTTIAASTETTAVETSAPTTTTAETSTAMATTTISEEPAPTDHLLIAGQGSAQGLPLKSTNTNGEYIIFGDRTSRWTVGRFVVDDTTGYLTRDGIPVCAKYRFMDRSASLTPCSVEYYQGGTSRLVCARNPAAGTALQCSAVKLDCVSSGPGDRQSCTVSTEANWTKFFISTTSDYTVYLGADDLATPYYAPVDIFVDRAPTPATPTAP